MSEKNQPQQVMDFNRAKEIIGLVGIHRQKEKEFLSAMADLRALAPEYAELLSNVVYEEKLGDIFFLL